MSEIKDIPEHWEIIKLGDLCDKISNGANVKQSDDKIGFPISRIETIWNETIDLNRVKYIAENNAEFIEKYTLKRDDILFSHINSDLHLGKTAVYKDRPEILIHGVNVLLIRLKKDVSTDFLNYQFKLKRSRGEFVKIAQKSVNQSSINQSKLKNVDFIVPPLSEQQAIVAKIEELLSELDNGKQQLQTALQQLKVYRQSLLKWAFEGKLTHTNVKEGELPDGWRIAELGTLSEMCLGKMLDKKKNKGSYQPYLRNISVRWGSFDLNGLEEMKFEPHEEERYSLNQGDLIVCEGGEPGRCAIWKGSVTNMKIQKALHRVRVKSMLSEIYLYHFMYYSAMSGLLKKYFTGTTIKHLTGRELKKIEIPLPPISEQQLIVDELESKLTLCDNIEETIKLSLQQAETLRQSILKKAFEGKLV